MSEQIAVEVAYALPESQRIVSLTVSAGTTALEAVQLSGIGEHFEELDTTAPLKLGVFGKAVASSYALSAGERVEIYRPLKIDPKEVRKQRAAKAKAAREE